jgi:hypothetical protein
LIGSNLLYLNSSASAFTLGKSRDDASDDGSGVGCAVACSCRNFFVNERGSLGFEGALQSSDDGLVLGSPASVVSAAAVLRIKHQNKFSS